MEPKGAENEMGSRTFCFPKRFLNTASIFYSFCTCFASPWAPFGLPFRSLWLPLGSLWPNFWFPLAPFGIFLQVTFLSVAAR